MIGKMEDFSTQNAPKQEAFDRYYCACPVQHSQEGLPHLRPLAGTAVPVPFGIFVVMGGGDQGPTPSNLSQGTLQLTLNSLGTRSRILEVQRLNPLKNKA